MCPTVTVPDTVTVCAPELALLKKVASFPFTQTTCVLFPPAEVGDHWGALVDHAPPLLAFPPLPPFQNTSAARRDEVNRLATTAPAAASEATEESLREARGNVVLLLMQRAAARRCRAVALRLST
jgi:hypothetical protein